VHSRAVFEVAYFKKISLNGVKPSGFEIEVQEGYCVPMQTECAAGCAKCSRLLFGSGTLNAIFI